MTMEKEFDVVVDQRGSVSIILPARDRSPRRPRIVHDKKGGVLLLRDDDTAVALDFIPRAALRQIYRARTVQITELAGKSRMIWSYTAEVRHDKSLRSRLT